MANGKNLHEKIDLVNSNLTGIQVLQAKQGERLKSIHSTMEDVKAGMNKQELVHRKDVRDLWKQVSWNKTKIVLATGGFLAILGLLNFM